MKSKMNKFKIGDLVRLWDYSISCMPPEYSGKVGRIVKLPGNHWDPNDMRYAVNFYYDNEYNNPWRCCEEDLTKVDCILDITWR